MQRSYYTNPRIISPGVLPERQIWASDCVPCFAPPWRQEKRVPSRDTAKQETLRDDGQRLPGQQHSSCLSLKQGKIPNLHFSIIFVAAFQKAALHERVTYL